jgi:hypothetical protein
MSHTDHFISLQDTPYRGVRQFGKTFADLSISDKYDIGYTSSLFSYLFSLRDDCRVCDIIYPAVIYRQVQET